MNFLFIFGQSLIFSGLFYLFSVKFMGRYIKNEDYIKAAKFFSVATLVLSFYFASLNHGPKLTLDRYHQTYKPQVKEFEKGEEMVKYKDRSKVFSDIIEK